MRDLKVVRSVSLSWHQFLQARVLRKLRRVLNSSTTSSVGGARIWWVSRVTPSSLHLQTTERISSPQLFCQVQLGLVCIQGKQYCVGLGDGDWEAFSIGPVGHLRCVVRQLWGLFIGADRWGQHGKIVIIRGYCLGGVGITCYKMVEKGGGDYGPLWDPRLLRPESWDGSLVYEHHAYHGSSTRFFSSSGRCFNTWISPGEPREPFTWIESHL